MNAYKNFGYYFDDITSEIDYNDWLEFSKKYIKREDKILDVACGSGTFLLLLSLLGYNVDGLDLSESMINIAKEKAKMNHIYPNLYIMDMTNINIDKKYNVITCFFDSVNHLESINQVRSFVKSVYNHLEDDGIFLFDVFSYYAFKNANNNTKEKAITCEYEWNTRVISDNELVHNITIKDNDSVYNEEYHEYYYDIDEIVKDYFDISYISGDFLDIYDSESGRLLVVAKKKDRT